MVELVLSIFVIKFLCQLGENGLLGMCLVCVCENGDWIEFECQLIEFVDVNWQSCFIVLVKLVVLYGELVLIDLEW